jgi:hypothetical protein
MHNHKSTENATPPLASLLHCTIFSHLSSLSLQSPPLLLGVQAPRRGQLYAPNGLDVAKVLKRANKKPSSLLSTTTAPPLASMKQFLMQRATTWPLRFFLFSLILLLFVAPAKPLNQGTCDHRDLDALQGFSKGLAGGSVSGWTFPNSEFWHGQLLCMAWSTANLRVKMVENGQKTLTIFVYISFYSIGKKTGKSEIEYGR